MTGETNEREFEHESLEDRESIVAYLNALKEGFESGAISFRGSDGELRIEPCGLVNFAVRARTKRDRVKLDVTISWRPRAEDNRSSGSKLLISAASANGNGQV